MNLLLAVAEDLFLFASSSIGKVMGFTVAERHHGGAGVIIASPRPERIGIEAPKVTELETEPGEAHLDTVFEPVVTAPQRNTVVYVSTSGAPLRTSPMRGVDNLIEHMPYGSMLVAMDTENNWVRAFFRGVEGYVELHDLADRAAYVYPKFVIGEANTAHDPNTERVRAYIGDEFSFGETALPLQAEEYVTYKLLRNGVILPWGKERPRTPGTWRKLLGRAKGIEVMHTPRPRSVIEYILGSGKGHVAFVESIFPDGAIQISEANWPVDGTYNERVLVKEEWQKLDPAFITPVSSS